MGSAASSKTLETDTETPAPPPPSQLPKDESNSRISDQPKSAQASSSDQSTQSNGDPSNEEKEREGGEEEEEGECGFCLFMKGGGCKDAFIAWENCVEAVEKDNQDIAERCFKVTAALKECMEAHSDYYEPILRVEKVAEAEVVKELEKQKAEDKQKEAAAASN